MKVAIMQERKNLALLILLLSSSVFVVEPSSDAQADGLPSYNCSSDEWGVGELKVLHKVDLSEFHLKCHVDSFLSPVGTAWHNPICVSVDGVPAGMKVFVRKVNADPNIFCESNSLINVKFDFLDARGSTRHLDNIPHAERRYDKKHNTTKFKVTLRSSERVSTRFTVTGLYENVAGELQAWTNPPISILALFDERRDVNILSPGKGISSFTATASEDVVLIPCLTHPAIEGAPFVYQTSGYSDVDLRCGSPSVNMSYDPLGGIYLNVTQVSYYARTSFLCCSSETCSTTNCTRFFIQDPEELVAAPRMPASGEPLRLFATQEDNAIPIVLECSFWGHVELRGALAWPFSRSRLPENITSRNYTVRQTRAGARVRYSATYSITLYLLEWLWVDCVEEATQNVLYSWNVTTNDAGLSNGVSEPAYLTLVERSDKDTEEATMTCRSEMYDDVHLRVIQCDTPEQCRLLEWCFDSAADGCVNRVVRNGTSNCLHVESRSCQDAIVPASGGLFRCTAGGHSYTQMRWVGLSGNHSYTYTETDFWNASLKHEIVRWHEIGYEPPFYTGLRYVFSLEMHSFFLESQARLLVGFTNQSFLQPAQPHDILIHGTMTKPFIQDTDVIFHSSDIDRLISVSPKRAEIDEWMTTSIVGLNVVDSIEPEIINEQSTFHFADDGEQKTIECVATGLPSPEIVWVKWAFDGAKLVIGPTLQHGMQTVNGSILRFAKFTKEYEGTYECSAGNGIGEGVTKNFTASLPIEGDGANGDDGGGSAWIIGLGAAGSAIIIALVPIGFLARCLFRKRVLDKETIELFRYGLQGDAELQAEDLVNQPGSISQKNSGVESDQRPEFFGAGTLPDEADETTESAGPNNPTPAAPISSWLSNVDRKPFDKRFEISRWTFKIDKSRQLGKGEFGVVYAGTVNLPGQVSAVQVAIKVNKKSCPEASLAGLLKEIKYMTYLQHENVVSLVAVNTAQARYGQLYILMELCEEGSLEQFFERKHCDYVEQQQNSGQTKTPNESRPPLGSHYQIIETKTFGLSELVRWCAEIAAGMEFLAAKGIVHRDLAARNVLLTTTWTAKVSDFGLSRQLYGSPVYQQKSTEMQLPLRWMAPECFTGTFSTQSDVWSFGVLAWEIFSIGRLPYEHTDFKDASQFHQLLCAGLRITERHKATEEIFSQLSDCWHETPLGRPSFSQLKNFFAQELSRVVS